MLKLRSKGMLSTIQDAGRRGYLSCGVSMCGAMDTDALYYANILVGNDINEAAIEITGAGPTLEFTRGNTFAFCGGTFTLTLDGAAIECGRAYQARKGSILEIGRAEAGFRGYLAVSGGFDLPVVMGSRSTDLKAKIGGLKGRALTEGDELPFKAPEPWLVNMENRALQYPNIKKDTLRVVLGVECDSFTPDSLETFFTEEYALTPQSDRMGCRLKGAELAYKSGFGPNVISNGIVPGAIQVPDGQPIILAADAQTVGGYSKIGAVISTDLPVLAQKKPGDTIRFEKVTPEQGRNIYLRRLRKLRYTADEINEPHWW